MIPIDSLISNLSGSGFLPFFAAFIFTFAVTFGLLQNLTFGPSKTPFPKGANIMIALVFGLITAVYTPISSLIFEFLPFAAVILLILFFFVFVTKIFGGEGGAGGANKNNAGVTLAILAISLLVIGGLWSQTTGFLGIDFSFSQDMMWIIGLVIVGLILYLGTRGQ